MWFTIKKIGCIKCLKMAYNIFWFGKGGLVGYLILVKNNYELYNNK